MVSNMQTAGGNQSTSFPSTPSQKVSHSQKEHCQTQVSRRSNVTILAMGFQDSGKISAPFVVNIFLGEAAVSVSVGHWTELQPALSLFPGRPARHLHLELRPASYRTIPLSLACRCKGVWQMERHR